MVLIALAIGLGGLAIWNMTTVGRKVTVVAEQRVPEVTISSDLIVSLQNVVLEMRDFGLTGNPAAYDRAQQKMKAVDNALEKGRTHAKTIEDGATLQAEIDAFTAKYDQYKKLCADTATIFKNYIVTRDAARINAKAFEESIDKLNEMESGKLTKAIETKADASKIAELIRQNDLATNILSAAFNMRLSNRRMQSDRDMSAAREVADYFKQISDYCAQMRKMTNIEAELKLIEAASMGATSYNKDTESMAKALESLNELAKQRMALADQATQEASKIVESGLSAATSASGDSAKSLSVSTTIMLIGLSIAVAVGIILAFCITRSITKPVQRIISSLTGGSEQTASASSQVASSSQNLAQGASEQAASLEETTSALQEMAAMTQKNAETAQQASTFAGEAKKAAEDGHLAMQRMSEAINQIEKSAGETAKIIKVIDEIAFQTNLLALNAAVEAARAGDAGKGFAVVAEEVRNLAMRSAEAAKNTSSLIEESVANARNGVTIVTDVAKSLEGINVSSTKVHSLVNEIAAASNEQSQGINQINTAMSQMDHVTQSNAAAAEESASAAEELSSQAIELNTVVARLQTIVTGRTPEIGQETVRHQNRNQTSVAPTLPPHNVAAENKLHKGKSGHPTKAEATIPLDNSEANGDFSDFSSEK